MELKVVKLGQLPMMASYEPLVATTWDIGTNIFL